MSFLLLPYFEAWAERSASASVIHGADLSIFWLNAAAGRLIREGLVVSAPDNRLHWIGDDQQSSYLQFIAKMDNGATWAYRPATAQARVVRAERLAPAGHPAAIAVLIYEVDRVDDPNLWADLGRAFGLTPAEADVTRRIVAGGGVTQTADALRISPETLRTHLKRVHQKLGVSSRDQLFALIAPYRAP